MNRFEIESLIEIRRTIEQLRIELLGCEAFEALPPIATAEFIQALDFLSLAERAVEKAELWRVHSKRTPT